MTIITQDGHSFTRVDGALNSLCLHKVSGKRLRKEGHPKHRMLVSDI